MNRFLTALCTGLLLLGCNRASEGPFRLTDLQVNQMTTPLGIDEAEPRFSWKMESGRYAQRQSAFRIVVTDAATGGQVWVSDPHPSDVSVGVIYAGSPLQPRTRYNWELTVWNAGADSVKTASWPARRWLTG